MSGILLTEKTWKEAEEILKKNPIIVLPIGGSVKEHGYHLPLGTDKLVVDDLAGRVLESCSPEVVMLPPLNYGYFPAFVGWPGTVSVGADNFKNFVADIIRSYAKQGIKRFLILDGGISTHYPLTILSYDLFNELGISVAVTNIAGLATETQDKVCETKEGGHGDESETSCMLAIRPDLVKLDLAKRDAGRPLPNSRGESGTLRITLKSGMKTKTGIVGDPRPATAQKGEAILSAMAQAIVKFLETFPLDLD